MKPYRIIVIILMTLSILSGCVKNRTNIQNDTTSKPNTTSITPITPTVAAIQKDNNLNWTWCIKPEQYSDLFFIDKDLVAAKQNNKKYVILDTKGKIAIPGDYSEVSNFEEGILSVDRKGKSFFINKKGENIFHKGYDDTLNFSEGLAGISKDGQWGYIDKTGKVVIRNQFSDARDFNEHSAPVQKNHKWGLIDESGKVILDFYYEEMNDFHNGYYAVRKKGKWGFVDKYGKVVAKCQYAEVQDYSEGYAAVRKNGKWGFINNKGKLCIDLKYNDVGNFSEGKAAVHMTKGKDDLGEWAYVDYKDNIVIDFYPYDAGNDASPFLGEFKDGLAFVPKTLTSIIDEKGKDVFVGDSKFFINDSYYNKEYDAIPGYVYIDDAMKIKKYGLMGLKGDQRLEPVFDYVDGIHDEYVIVENLVNDDYKFGLIKLEKK